METKIIINGDGLNSMEVGLSTDSEYRFEDSNVRKVINELGFGLGCLYYFYKTTLNPKADKAIKEAFRSFEHGGVRGWHFNASMMKVLLKVIHDDSEREGIAHVYFPLVENVGVHDVDVNPEEGYRPVVHILKDATSDQRVDFAGIVESVLENSWDEIQKRESPFNYNMGEFQLLKDRQIQPLLVGEQKAVFTGDVLKRAADWLLPYQYICEAKTEYSVWDD